MIAAVVFGGLGLVALVITCRILAALLDSALWRAIRAAWRFCTGERLDGRPVTNAGWGRRGTKALTPTGHASRWAHQRREIRAAARLGALLVTFGTAAGLVLDAAAVALAWSAVLTAGQAASGTLGYRVAVRVESGRRWVRPLHLALGLVGGVIYRAAVEWQHMRRWVRPLHLALGGVLGVPDSVRPKSWLAIPRDYARREGAEVVVQLPPGFAATADVPKQMITDLVCAKLALESPAARWHLAGRQPHVSYTVQVPPPAKVNLSTLANLGAGKTATVRQLIIEGKAAMPLVGLGRSARPTYADLDQDSPHVIFSMGSGAGKSVALRALAVGEMYRGAVILVLDIKRLSHAWARGLPNVRYCRSIEEIHDALLWLGDETDRRNVKADEGADVDGNTDHVDVGPRIIVLAEELNALSKRLAAYWQRIKTKDDPNSSPAMDALGDVFFMGRQIKINIFAVAQMFTARTVGGPEARENAGVRILGRYTMNNARMLVPEIWPFPRSSRTPGRVQVCIGGKAHETQVVFMSPAEARELATAGVVSRFPDAEAPEGLAARQPATITRLRLAGSAEPVGLREAIASGILPVPEGSTIERHLAATRQARARDPEFPKSRDQNGPSGEHRYDPDELAAWARNRPRAAVASGE